MLWLTMYLLTPQNWTWAFFFGVTLKGGRNIILYDPYLHEKLTELKGKICGLSTEVKWRLFNTNLVLSRLSDLLTYGILTSLAITDYYIPGTKWLGSLNQNKGIDEVHSLRNLFLTYAGIELTVFIFLFYRAYCHQGTRRYFTEITKYLLRYKWAFALVTSFVVIRGVMYAIDIAKK